jgi:hypothetical protein
VIADAIAGVTARQIALALPTRLQAAFAIPKVAMSGLSLQFAGQRTWVKPRSRTSIYEYTS